jgi:predicted ArsR family transcriptional regulator
MVPNGAQIYVPPCFHPGDILGLPQQQRQITAYLSRRGESDPATMAQDLGRTLAQVRIDLASMAKKGYVQHLPDGKARLVFGHSRRSKLPNDILDALS